MIRKLRLVVCGAILTAVSAWAQLQTDFTNFVVGPVTSLAVAPSGDILMAGHLWASRVLNPDGSLKFDFDALQRVIPGQVKSFAVLKNGGYVAAGDFTKIRGQSKTNIASFLANGDLDLSFQSPASEFVDLMLTISTLSTGDFLVAGSFDSLGGPAITNLAKLRPGGTLDDTFVNTVPGHFYGFISEPDDMTILTGMGMARINPDGSPVTYFDTITNYITCGALQGDGKILVGLNEGVRRFDPDGSLDADFHVAADNAVYALSVQADGKMIVGGFFTKLNDTPVSGLARLNPDGTLDTSFVAPQYETVRAVALQPDGKVIVGTSFSVSRLNNTGPASDSLTSDGTTIIWMRGGTAPEVSRVLFQSSPDGTNWSDLASPTRIPGGWKLQNLALAEDSHVRALGWVSAGQFFGSSWYVESLTRVVSRRATIAPRSAGFRPQSSDFHFEFHAQPGQEVVVETSSDLRSWTPVRTNTCGNEPLSFTEPATKEAGARFFRLRTSH